MVSYMRLLRCRCLEHRNVNIYQRKILGLKFYPRLKLVNRFTGTIPFFYYIHISFNYLFVEKELMNNINDREIIRLLSRYIA